MRTKLLGLVIALGAITFANASSKLEITDPRAAKIDSIITLPIKGMKAVDSDGQIVFLSDNGRFVISGQLYDLWSKKPLSTISELQDVAERIHFKNFGMDVDTLNTVSMGHGKKEVVIFTDPRCDVCRKLIDEAKSLEDEYTFKIIVIPALGDESNRLAKAMYCAKDKDKVLGALQSNALESLAVKTPCDPGQYDQTLLTAHLIGIEGVPFIVAQDGRISKGRPQNLKAWLESKQ
ncbi:DsbC family protein [Edwardsiella piscicida]|uniref:Thiol:disulfide interchange protein n=1 Tax=Edwardsiella anguillarum ET080813 TaxID=667120 RepID=A0A076LVI2_9GAMM|nr:MULTISPECIES: DsbC family protein [Edwardsiella]EGA8339116.1 DsbC family protein [Salmonella enterica subsp. enterica serovar Saintpaul]EKG9744429.1 DsbC family protein [Salmonella enterica]NJS89710.1 DsbC family protein [Escherichia coli]AIJ10672.1 Thiol:disulfide involved in conjugative transfer [Edwardsiella anguillarum ET080813]EKS7763329.1 DsbC family protein [Edwardsiella ictaluri]